MKKIIFTLTFLFLSTNLFSYDWPVNKGGKQNIKTQFGRNINGTISSSLVLDKDFPVADPKKKNEKTENSEPPVMEMEVSEIEEGKIIAVINDYEDSNDFFPSTLGNAVIMIHDNSVISVYGNLDGKSIDKKETKGIIGTTATSAWKENSAACPLILQIVDTKNNIAINPVTILPQEEKEPVPLPSNIRLKAKNGKIYELSPAQIKSVPQGQYTVYQAVSPSFMPHKTLISINGTEEDSVSYDNIAALQNKTWIKGSKKNYTKETVYPDKDSLFAGEISLMPGKSVLTLSNFNIANEEKSIILNLSVY